MSTQWAIPQASGHLPLSLLADVFVVTTKFPPTQDALVLASSTSKSGRLTRIPQGLVYKVLCPQKSCEDTLLSPFSLYEMIDVAAVLLFTLFTATCSQP